LEGKDSLALEPCLVVICDIRSPSVAQLKLLEVVGEGGELNFVKVPDPFNRGSQGIECLGRD
jgi:hypothetical protein